MDKVFLVDPKDPSKRAWASVGSLKSLESAGYKPFGGLTAEKKKKVTDSLGLPDGAPESEVALANSKLRRR